MQPWIQRLRALTTRRSQHLVFLAHVWALAPFLVLWLHDKRIQAVLGTEVVTNLKPVVYLIELYLVVRTILAFKDPKWLKWEYVFPPFDVAIISLMLYLSHRGPMSNLGLLYFLPIVQASGTAQVKWAAAVALMVIVGLTVATIPALSVTPVFPEGTMKNILKTEALNISFRLYFTFVLSSLLAYQALLAGQIRERLAVAADRNRIALEMHDGVQGSLIAVGSQLELISRIAQHDPQRATELAQQGRETARQAADELRFLVHRMRGPALTGGFIPALRQYAHNVSEGSGLRMEFAVHGAEGAMEPEVEHALFRIAQESLTNVVKHSCATTARVEITYRPEEVELVVADDGQKLSEPPQGNGIEGMRERARLANGLLMMKAENGLTVTAQFPRREANV